MIALTLGSQAPDGYWWAELESNVTMAAEHLLLEHFLGIRGLEGDRWPKIVRYLLSLQQPDGSWHVVSRSKPFQPYFESGFPHGKDQFISMAASAWSTAALILACPPAAPH